ncbi:nucleoside recognition domain-containing protein [Clostridium sp. BJN0001]|uniref:YjiH family protein n=1 Tax=Clostridium sp. BJN0001 TaxID=2930219 RepID=UPI001FD4DDD5|nr:nucleoside recognition domain-containing protein [Clostridium sp. BJN0001]
MNLTSKEESNNKLTGKLMIKFLILSSIGVGLFMFPVYKDGNITNGMSIASNFIEDCLSAYSEYIVFVITCISAFLSLLAVLFKPKFILSNRLFKKLFYVSPIYLITKLIAFFVCFSVVFKVGPEVIYSNDIGAGMVDLSKTLVAIAITLSFMLPLLTDCGTMEFFGILLRDYVRPVFKVPGRACVDMITSWLGSSNTAVLVTRQQYEAGYYSKREAASIMTNFSLVSIPFCMVVASALDLTHIFPVFYLCITLLGIFLAVIGVRVPPLSSIDNTYLKM